MRFVDRRPDPARSRGALGVLVAAAVLSGCVNVTVVQAPSVPASTATPGVDACARETSRVVGSSMERTLEGGQVVGLAPYTTAVRSDIVEFTPPKGIE